MCPSTTLSSLRGRAPTPFPGSEAPRSVLDPDPGPPAAALRPAPGTAAGRPESGSHVRLLHGRRSGALGPASEPIPAPCASRGSFLPDRFLLTAPDQLPAVTTLRPWLGTRVASSGLRYPTTLLTFPSCLVPRGRALPKCRRPPPRLGGEGGERWAGPGAGRGSGQAGHTAAAGWGEGGREKWAACPEQP